MLKQLKKESGCAIKHGDSVEKPNQQYDVSFMQPPLSTLFKIQEGPSKIIASHLNREDLDRLRNASTPFRDNLYLRLNLLLNHIVDGNKEGVSTIIGLNLNPALLLCKISHTTDTSGREFKNLSPLQVALCCGDDEIYKLMIKYLSFDPDIEAKVKQQMKEIITDVDIIQNMEKDVFDFKKIKNAIAVANFSDVTSLLDGAENPTSQLWKDLQTFKEQFDEQIRKDKVSHPHHLLEALKIFDYYHQYYCE